MKQINPIPAGARTGGGRSRAGGGGRGRAGRRAGIPPRHREGFPRRPGAQAAPAGRGGAGSRRGARRSHDLPQVRAQTRPASGCRWLPAERPRLPVAARSGPGRGSDLPPSPRRGRLARGQGGRGGRAGRCPGTCCHPSRCLRAMPGSPRAPPPPRGKAAPGQHLVPAGSVTGARDAEEMPKRARALKLA